MTILESFYQQDQMGIQISAEQGSRFAKTIADDFNPIHDADSKRFCVPGDLLFAIALEKYGISPFMRFEFAELVKADSVLRLPDRNQQETALLEVLNQRDKTVLRIELQGQARHGEGSEEQLIREYVRFSGQNFPGILLPLMQKHNVMINPARPLVMYQKMSVEFDALQFSELSVVLADTELIVEGKRGTACLEFDLLDAGEKIGHGRKTLLLSGLREYEEDAIQDMCRQYEESRDRSVSA